MKGKNCFSIGDLVTVIDPGESHYGIAAETFRKASALGDHMITRVSSTSCSIRPINPAGVTEKELWTIQALCWPLDSLRLSGGEEDVVAPESFDLSDLLGGVTKN